MLVRDFLKREGDFLAPRVLRREFGAGVAKADKRFMDYLINVGTSSKVEFRTFYDFELWLISQAYTWERKTNNP